MKVKDIAKGVTLSALGTPLGAKEYYKNKMIEDQVRKLEESGENAEPAKQELLDAIDPKNYYYVLREREVTTVAGAVLIALLKKDGSLYDKIAPFCKRRNYDKYYLFSQEADEHGLYQMLSYEKQAEAIAAAKELSTDAYKVSSAGKFQMITE